MTTKSKSFEGDSLEWRVAKLEEDVELISQTVYDLIDTLQRIPDPPCPPMCSQVIGEGKSRSAKRRGKKK